MKTKIYLKTPITYYGGKQKMLPEILPEIPEHTLYCEPFAGGAAVFFAKEPAKTNVINDLNAELINFYKILKHNSKELLKYVDDTLHSRDLHRHAWYIYNNSHHFNDVQRAWAVFVLSKQGFAGQLSSSFGFDKQNGKHPKRVASSKLLISDELIKVLENTTIECDDALTVIKRFDIDKAFFFVDPPYIGANMGHYSGMFNEQNLNETIKQFADNYKWRIKEIERMVTTSIRNPRKQKEWIVMNY